MYQKRKIKLPQILCDDAAQFLALVQFHRLLPRNVIYNYYKPKYSVYTIKKTLNYLGYKLVGDKTFIIYSLVHLKKFSIQGVSKILNTDYKTTKYLLECAETYVKEINENPKNRY